MLVEQRKGSFDDVEEEEEGYDTSREDEGFSEEESVDGSPFFLSSLRGGRLFPSNYFPNFTLHNLNDKFNASLNKLYERTPHLPQFPQFAQFSRPHLLLPPSQVRQRFANLYNTLVDEEYKENQKRKDFEIVRREKIDKWSRGQRRRTVNNSLNSSQEEDDDDDSYPQNVDEDSRNVRLNRRRHSSQQSANEENEEKISTKRREKETSSRKVEEEKEETDDPLHDDFWSKAFEVKESNSTMTTLPRPPVNPFYSRINLTMWDKLKMVLLFPVVLVRMLGMFVFLSLSIAFTYVGLAGLSFEETSSAPLAPWRRRIRWVCAHVWMRAFFFCAGFQWVTTTGRQASRKEAPILVVAPHSSYFDAFAVTQCGGVSVFAKESTKSIPIFGKLIDFTQPIYVNREDASSRQGSVAKLRERVRSAEDFPQVIMFPEGTTSNRSALAQFKPGAFVAGVAVQPVVIRFPNRVDSVTWTWDSPAFYKSFFLSLSQFTTFMNLDFLPPVVPSPEELDDPALFANNVQSIVAQSLGIPATNFSLEDGFALQKLNETKLRLKLERMWKIKGKLNMRASTTETTLLREGISRSNFDWDFTLSRFLSTIFPGRSSKDFEELVSLFNLFKKTNTATTTAEGEETIDLRAYCFLDFIMFATTETSFDNVVRLIFRAYAGRDGTTVSRELFGKIMRNVFEAEEKDTNAVFYGRRDPSEFDVISYQDFFDKIIRRVEYVKLFAMEATGQRSGNYPKRDERDLLPHFHSD